MNRGAAALVVVACALAPLPARAYTRYRTDAGVPFYWPEISHVVTGYPNDMTGMMTADQVAHAAAAAAASWSHDTNLNACTYLEITTQMSTDPTPVAQHDNKNSLIFRRTSWCSPTDVPPSCTYDSLALALTSVFVGRTSGKIVDADIEVNALDYVWRDLDLDPTDTQDQDLQNALTHEFGHFIGLDHTCYIAGSLPVDQTTGNPIIPIDNNGDSIPQCSNSLPESIRATTMYASAPAGDTSKRTLEADDRLGLCQIYPIDMPPRPDSQGCACDLGAPVGAGGGAPGGLAGLAAALGFMRTRRRR